MMDFERAYEIDTENTNFNNESYMNFCKDLVDFCNERGGRIYKGSVVKENITITKEDLTKANARKYTCQLTVLDTKEIINRKKVCRQKQEINVSNEGGIIRKIKTSKGV